MTGRLTGLMSMGVTVKIGEFKDAFADICFTGTEVASWYLKLQAAGLSS